MTKRFKVEVSSDNYVHFIEDGVNIISIGFKEYADAESCKNRLLSFCNRLNKLAEENEQLKQSRANILQELLIYRRIASCDNCEHQTYDWFEDDDEFEICKKGNDNQQMEYHICEEWREI